MYSIEPGRGLPRTGKGMFSVITRKGHLCCLPTRGQQGGIAPSLAIWVNARAERDGAGLLCTRSTMQGSPAAQHRGGLVQLGDKLGTKVKRFLGVGNALSGQRTNRDRSIPAQTVDHVIWTSQSGLPVSGGIFSDLWCLVGGKEAYRIFRILLRTGPCKAPHLQRSGGMAGPAQHIMGTAAI